MASLEQLTKLRRRLPDATDAELNAVLDDAEDAILSRRFPFSEAPTMLEDKYKGLQIRIAVVLYNKIGAEGESAHSELGVNRKYESLDVLLKEVTPKGVVR